MTADDPTSDEWRLQFLHQRELAEAGANTIALQSFVIQDARSLLEQALEYAEVTRANALTSEQEARIIEWQNKARAWLASKRTNESQE